MEWEESEMSLEDSPEAKKMKLAEEIEGEAPEIEQDACINRDKTSTYMEAKIGDPSSSRSAVAKESSLFSQYTGEPCTYPLPDHIKKTLFELSTVRDLIDRLRTGSTSEVKESLAQLMDGHKQKSPTKNQSERNVGVGYSKCTKQFVESCSLRGESSKAEQKLLASSKSSGVGSKTMSKGTYRSSPKVKKTKTIRNRNSTKVEVLAKESSKCKKPMKVDFQSVSTQKLSMESSGQDVSEVADFVEEEQEDIEPKAIKEIFRCLQEKFTFFHRQRKNTRIELKLIIRIYKYIEELHESNVNGDELAVNHPLDARYSRLPKFIERLNKLRQAGTNMKRQLEQTNDVIKASLEKINNKFSDPLLAMERGRGGAPECDNFTGHYSATTRDVSLSDGSNFTIFDNSMLGPLCAGSESDINTGITSEGLKIDDPRVSRTTELAYMKVKLFKPFLSTYQKQIILTQQNSHFEQEFVLNKIYENILELKSLYYMPYAVRPVALFTSIFEREYNLRREISQSISRFIRLLEQETNEMIVFFHLNRPFEVAVDVFDAPMRRRLDPSGIPPIRTPESGMSSDGWSN